MGKSFELLGMAAFNTFLGLILAVTFLSQAGKNAVTSFTDQSVRAFVNEMTHMISKSNQEFDDYALTDYFMNHIDDAGRFTTTVSYSLPNAEEEKKETLDMDKIKYISQVIQARKAMNQRGLETVIEYVDVDDSGKKATVITTNTERGMMKMTQEDGTYTEVPVTGISYCEQALTFDGKRIKIASATCSTTVNFTDSL